MYYKCLISMFSYDPTVQLLNLTTISPPILGQIRQTACQSIRISELEVTAISKYCCNDDHHGAYH